jgi:hypothetical protein
MGHPDSWLPYILNLLNRDVWSFWIFAAVKISPP